MVRGNLWGQSLGSIFGINLRNHEMLILPRLGGAQLSAPTDFHAQMR